MSFVKKHKGFLFMLSDFILLALSFLLGLYFRFNGNIPWELNKEWFRFIVLFIGIKLIIYYLAQLYHILWKFAGMRDLWRIIIANVAASVLVFGLNRFRGQAYGQRTVRRSGNHLGGLAREPLLGPGDHLEGVGVERLFLRVHHLVDGEQDVVRLELRAVMELDPLAQAEGVGLAVRGDVPGFGQAGDDDRTALREAAVGAGKAEAILVGPVNSVGPVDPVDLADSAGPMGLADLAGPTGPVTV